MIDNSKRTGAAVEAHYQFLTWLIPTIKKFPRSHKFAIGDRIEIAALDVLEALIEATYTKERTQHLRSANLGTLLASTRESGSGTNATYGPRRSMSAVGSRTDSTRPSPLCRA